MLGVALVGQFMMVLDVTIMNVAASMSGGVQERGPRAECQCPGLWSAEPCSSRSKAQVL
jgi:hypothetical protein